MFINRTCVVECDIKIILGCFRFVLSYFSVTSKVFIHHSNIVVFVYKKQTNKQKTKQNKKQKTNQKQKQNKNKIIITHTKMLIIIYLINYYTVLPSHYHVKLVLLAK